MLILTSAFLVAITQVTCLQAAPPKKTVENKAKEDKNKKEKKVKSGSKRNRKKAEKSRKNKRKKQKRDGKSSESSKKKDNNNYLDEKRMEKNVKDIGSARVIGKTKSGKTIYEGPRGGHFYYNDKGKKVYIKR